MKTRLPRTSCNKSWMNNTHQRSGVGSWRGNAGETAKRIRRARWLRAERKTRDLCAGGRCCRGDIVAGPETGSCSVVVEMKKHHRLHAGIRQAIKTTLHKIIISPQNSHEHQQQHKMPFRSLNVCIFFFLYFCRSLLRPHIHFIAQDVFFPFSIVWKRYFVFVERINSMPYRKYDVIPPGDKRNQRRSRRQRLCCKWKAKVAKVFS